MKKIIVLLLLACCTLAADVDIHRDIQYIINKDMDVDTTYTDYFFANPQATFDMIKLYPSEAEYIESRVAPDFTLQNFEIKMENNILKVMMHGQYDSYVEKKGPAYKVGGKGFIDRTCKDYPVDVLTEVVQSFNIEAQIPDNYHVVSQPEEIHFSGAVIKIDYIPKVEGNKLTETIFFEVQNASAIRDYCLERDEINKGLQVGFYIAKTDFTWTIVIGAILLVILLMLVISKRLI